MKSKFILKTDNGKEIAITEGWRVTYDQDVHGPVQGVKIMGHKDAWGDEPRQYPMSNTGLTTISLERNQGNPEYFNLFFLGHGRGCTSIGFKESDGKTDLSKWTRIWYKNKFTGSIIKMLSRNYRTSSDCPTCGRPK